MTNRSESTSITKDNGQKCRLFMGNLPKVKTEKEIFDEVSRITRGHLVRVITYKNFDDPSMHRGFCFLDYRSVAAAKEAKRVLSRQKVFGCKTTVDWADPEPQVDADTMATVRILFVRQYGGVLDERALTKVFGRYGVVERVKNLKNYAFVHFERREDAQSAMDAMDCSKDVASGVRLDVAWAKPPADKRTRQRILRDRERRVRKSAISAMSQPACYAPRPPCQAPGAKKRVGPPPAPTNAAYTKFEYRGYDLRPRQPCIHCTPTLAVTIPVAKATSDKRNSGIGRRCRFNVAFADQRRAVRHDDGDWKKGCTKRLTFFDTISTSCTKKY
ncbi:heterogeneous nuclear ribonucleoprotein Q-like [Sipha flava]|uniref:Heterogeneous nuclear ribonucleoprotein Q-like n=1 Tax=Sipha flava TaxID=143950 RepID=A0A8B8FWM6_9HEMI|nr:heterogeneous nuclear ribonucleoprotein Q-like [Sipha flava]